MAYLSTNIGAVFKVTAIIEEDLDDEDYDIGIIMILKRRQHKLP